MNDLNSLLLEGTILKNPIIKKDTCHFPIVVKKDYINGDIAKKEASFFKIIAYGKFLENYKKWLKKGQSIRLVGELKNLSKYRNNIVIVAEHIEYKYS